MLCQLGCGWGARAERGWLFGAWYDQDLPVLSVYHAMGDGGFDQSRQRLANALTAGTHNDHQRVTLGRRLREFACRVTAAVL